MTLERKVPEIPRQPRWPLKVAWVANALLATLTIWGGFDRLPEPVVQREGAAGALTLFLAGSVSGAAADASAGLIRLLASGPRSSASEVLLGLSIVLLVASIICLALGLAALAAGPLAVARI